MKFYKCDYVTTSDSESRGLYGWVMGTTASGFAVEIKVDHLASADYWRPHPTTWVAHQNLRHAARDEMSTATDAAYYEAITS